MTAMATASDGVGRLRARGAVLALGAVLTSVLIAPVGGLSLYWMPLFVGVSYLLRPEEVEATFVVGQGFCSARRRRCGSE